MENFGPTCLASSDAAVSSSVVVGLSLKMRDFRNKGALKQYATGVESHREKYIAGKDWRRDAIYDDPVV